jgi:hypothetical protein
MGAYSHTQKSPSSHITALPHHEEYYYPMNQPKVSKKQQ